MAGGLSDFVTTQIDRITDRVMDRMEPLIERKIDELSAKVLALLPIITATAAKTVVDQIIARMPDIDIPVISDVFDLTETIRNDVNHSVPDIDIPILSDLFDLTDLFKRR
jgi:hypothetical protein